MTTPTTAKPIGVWKVEPSVPPALTEADVAEFRSICGSLNPPVADGHRVQLSSGIVMIYDEWDAL